MNLLTKKKFAEWALLAILAAFLIATFFYLIPGIPESRAPSSSNTSTNGSVSFVGPVTFEFTGNNSTEVTAAAGSTVRGTITINILQQAPLRFYIDDIGYNSSSSTLPTGISISLNIYGNAYDPPLLSNANSQPPLVPTVSGETTLQYEISTSSSVPRGVYDARIVCWSFLNNGTVSDQAEVYQVTLHIQ